MRYGLHTRDSIGRIDQVMKASNCSLLPTGRQHRASSIFRPGPRQSKTLAGRSHRYRGVGVGKETRRQQVSRQRATTTDAGAGTRQRAREENPRGRGISTEAVLKAVSAVAFLFSVYFAWQSSAADGAERTYEDAFQNYLSLRSISQQHALMAITTDSPGDYGIAATVASDAVAMMVLQPGILKEPAGADAQDKVFGKKSVELMLLKDVNRLASVNSLSEYRTYYKELEALERELGKYFSEQLANKRESGTASPFCLSRLSGSGLPVSRRRRTPVEHSQNKPDAGSLVMVHSLANPRPEGDCQAF